MFSQSNSLRSEVALMARTPSVSALSIAVLLATTACEKQQQAATDASSSRPLSSTVLASNSPPFELTASIGELMDAIIDPSADSLWDSVGTTIDAKGSTQHQPSTAAEWQAARRHAIALIEGINLLLMDGRKIVAPGAAMRDEGAQGVLSTAEGERKFADQHGAFVGYALALRASAEQMLQAIDAKNPEGMMTAGGKMDEVCEACHLTFWYPNQIVPKAP
jgi:hypothetical protein